MRDETGQALALFVEKANRLLSGRFVQYIQEHGGPSYKISFERGKDTEVEIKAPDQEAIDAFILTFRFFIQKNERISFRGLTKVLDDDGLSDEWKQGFSQYSEIQRQQN
jgi:hypothetical protein